MQAPTFKHQVLVAFSLNIFFGPPVTFSELPSSYPQTTAMKKAFVPKAFLLFTLLFVAIAAASFAAFQEQEEVCAGWAKTCNAAKPGKTNELLWEVVARRILSLVSI